MELKKEQVKTLCSFIGYGDYQNADIIILGNEEGLGGLSYDVAVRHRVEAFGTDTKYYLNPNEKSEGFWEPGGELTEIKKKEFLEKNGEEYNKKSVSRSTFLQFCARLVLSLEKPSTKDFWFQKFGTDKNRNSIINDYKYNKLFCEREKDTVRTVLLDWAPIPRADESENGKEWPYTGVVDGDKYQRVFISNKSISDDYYMDLKKDRIQIIKNAITKFKIPLLIAPGNPDVKKAILEQIFEGIQFQEIQLPSAGLSILCANVDCNGSKITVIVSGFFDNWGTGHLKLAGLQDLAEFIKPIYIEAKHNSKK